MDVYDGMWLLDDGSDADSDCSTDIEQCDYDNLHDPISHEEMQRLQASSGTVLHVCIGPLVGPSDRTGLQLESFSLGDGQRAGRHDAGISGKAMGHPEESGCVASTSKTLGSALTKCQRKF